MRKVPYPTSGAILLEEFLNPMGTTQYRLSKEIGVPQRRIGNIVAGKRAISADTGLRLSRFFGTSEAFWIGLQADYDRETAQDAMAKALAKIKPWRKATRSQMSEPERGGGAPATGESPTLPALEGFGRATSLSTKDEALQGSSRA